METISRFCRDCYQTTPHNVRYLNGVVYDCNVCNKSGESIWVKETKKEDIKMELEEGVLRALEKKGTATAKEISAEMKVPVEEVKKVLTRLETVGMLLMTV